MKTTDNKRTVASEVSISKGFINAIANKELKELVSDQLFLFPPDIGKTDDLSSEQKIFEANPDLLKTTNIMGVISYKNEQLFIGSRFDGEKDYFFYYLLKKVLNINVIDKDVNMEMKRGYLNLLIFLFPKYLNLALRKGLFKEYKVMHHNNSNVKGKVAFKRHMKENTPFIGKVAYNTREFSYDNTIINLIRYTIEFIKMQKEFRGVLNVDDTTRGNVNLIEENSFNYRKLNITNVIQHNLKKPVTHGYYFEYRDLQTLCLAILRESENIYKKTSHNSAFGILFDGAWLFEEYINLLIQDGYHHPQNKSGIGRQYLFNNSVGLIYPDFISRNSINRTIADAKYKRFGGISGRDYLQLLAYMYRFDARRGYFIYPEDYGAKDEKSKTLSMMQGISMSVAQRSDSIDIKKVGIKIPNDAYNFQEFEERIRKSETELRQNLDLE